MVMIEDDSDMIIGIRHANGDITHVNLEESDGDDAAGTCGDIVCCVMTSATGGCADGIFSADPGTAVSRSTCGDAEPFTVDLDPIETPSVQDPLKFPTKICKILFQGFSNTLATPKIIDDDVVGKELIIYPKYLEASPSYDPDSSLIIFKFNARLEFKLTKDFVMIPGDQLGSGTFEEGDEVIYVCPGYP